MLKRVLAISAALVMGAFAFADTLADGGASPAAAGSVNATWGNWTSIPKSKITTDEFTYKKPVVIDANAGSKGAAFQLEKGAVKFKTESYTALYHGTKSSSTVDSLLVKPGDRKAEYSITINDAADITFTLAGNGSAGKERCVVLVKLVDAGDGTQKAEKIWGIDGLSQDVAPVPVTYKNAPKGTYYLYGNGFRIVAVEAKN